MKVNYMEQATKKFQCGRIFGCMSQICLHLCSVHTKHYCNKEFFIHLYVVDLNVKRNEKEGYFLKFTFIRLHSPTFPSSVFIHSYYFTH